MGSSVIPTSLTSGEYETASNGIASRRFGNFWNRVPEAHDVSLDGQTF